MFNIVPHIADVRLKIAADTLPELFVSALEGMNSILKSNNYRKNKVHAVTQEIAILSRDTTALLIDFLSEVLTYSYIHQVIFNHVDFLEFHKNNLHAKLSGVRVLRFTGDIKAVTYHEAEVKKTNGKWQTTIVFDI